MVLTRITPLVRGAGNKACSRVFSRGNIINISNNNIFGANGTSRRLASTDALLDDVSKAIRDTCRRFADEELTPIAGQLDKEVRIIRRRKSEASYTRR